MSRALLIVVLVLGIAASVAAGPNDNWIVYVKAADSTGANGLATSCLLGTKLGATDSPAESTNDASNLGGSGTGAVLGCFDLGAGSYYNGYYKDLRAPYDAATHPLPVYNLRLWLQPSWTFGDLYLTGWNQTGSYALNGSFQMALKVVNDPTGAYAPGTVLCTFGSGAHGTTSSPEFTAVFHNIAPIKGASYVSLQLVQSIPAVVPEPAGIMSLISLLGGLSGFALIRKRQS